MFAQMVSTLKNGALPEMNLLRKRFDAALVKKMGVIRTPCSFWPSDTKINPPAKHLLWAAILLQDAENFKVVSAIISTELEEKQRAKGQPQSIQALSAKVQQLLQEYIREFVELAPDEACRKNFRQRAEELFPDLEQ